MKKNSMLLVLPLIAFMVGCNANQGQGSGKQSESKEDTQTSESQSSESEPSSESPVLHPSVKIADGERKVFITKQLTLIAEVKDSEDAIVWTSSDPAKATVEGGIVTAVAPGKVSITAALSSDASIKDEVEITILDTIIDASVNAAAWDFSKLYQAEPVIESVAAANTNDIKTYAAFKGVLGKQYVAKAHFDVKSVGDWVWNTLTIGHINGDGQIYATGFSQGTKKLITQFSKTVGGVEQLWGAMSDRSQIWSQHDLDTFDVTNGIDIMSVRDGGDFYFFMNNELYWKESAGFNDYDEIDTQPVIYLNGVNATISNLYVSAEATDVEAVVNSEAAQKKMYATFSANVVISENDTKVQFKNADNITTNNKDVAAKSIGDAFSFPAGKSAKLEFDLTIDAWGGTHSGPAVLVDIKRYESKTAETRSVLIGERCASFAGWNYDGGMPAENWPAGEKTYADEVKLAENKGYHVIVNRIVGAEGADNSVKILDGETVLVDSTWGWANDGYTGIAAIYLSSRNVNATLSNIAISMVE